MSSNPPVRRAEPLHVDRRVVWTTWIADLCVVAAVLATVVHRSFLGLVLAIVAIGLAVSARRRVGRHRRWAGSSRALLAVIGGAVVVFFSLPFLIGGIAGLWHLG
ncbi:hypothetical protein LK09_01000 [Microbacterium mangrovi]|uniref:Uncharacterized protein n=1 Tax=Microbacterium mangrovi TaxID=1348253 RepID=A0A0B2A9T9_9MICO|nr:hypothetical protein [Microbacterium mangrovi]KHK99934.1 hypothetical protein LK09_01000 [Microbacterium mangrovi]